MRRPRGFTLIELIFVVALIALLVTMLLPVLAETRWQGRRAGCMGNLKSATNGLLTYANTADNRGRLPTRGFGWDTQRFDLIGWDLTVEAAGTNVHSNSRNLFLAVRLRHLQPAALVCPNTNDEPAALGGSGDTYYDFNVGNGADYRSKLSYSHHLQFGDRDADTPGYPLTNASDSRMAVLADRTPCASYPGIAAGTGCFADTVGIPAGASASEIRSHNHDDRGQNVAFMDARVEWHTTATVGPDEDNIYTVWDDADHDGQWQPDERKNGIISEASMPAGQMDCFLVP